MAEIERDIPSAIGMATATQPPHPLSAGGHTPRSPQKDAVVTGSLSGVKWFTHWRYRSAKAAANSSIAAG